MKIEKQELASKLNKLKRILPSRPTIECLKGILLKNNSIFVNNLEMAMMTPLDIDTEEEFILPQKAIEMIESLPAGQIEITCDKNYSITIKTDNIKNRFQSFNPDEYPDTSLNIDTGEEKTIVPGEVLQEAMNSIIYAVSTNDRKPAITGMLRGLFYRL